MVVSSLVLMLLLGLVMGSFIGALTWRLPRSLGIIKGRSYCDNCHKKINWYDNIPLVSFFVLKGKCRYCKRQISLRYPLIELMVGLGFVAVFVSLPAIPRVFPWLASLENFKLTASLLIFLMLVVVFIIDFEHQIILDEVVFSGWLLVVFIFGIVNFNQTFVYLLAGFLGALVFLLIHLATFGKGMGLGDVKLALFLGTMTGLNYLFIWLFLSFLIGALTGLILLILKKISVKAKIAFGPFMVIGFLVLLVFKDIIS